MRRELLRITLPRMYEKWFSEGISLRSSRYEKEIPHGSFRRRMDIHEPHLPAPKGYGRPRTHDLREILNAIFYLLKSGCQWRLLPHDFPRWPTVYHYFRTWRM